MLAATSCNRILADKFTTSLANQVRSELASEGVDVRIDCLPCLYDIFTHMNEEVSAMTANAPGDLYPTCSQPVNLMDTMMIMHSSGSTGHPKSIHFTHKRILHFMVTSEPIRSL